MRNYKDLIIWKKSIDIVKEIYRLAELLPDNEKFGLKSQICRAAISISSNIAEGCSRSSENDFKRFLEISIGSAFELETQLIVISELDFISKKRLEYVFKLIKDEQKKIGAFISKIKQRI
jgi:four helix bundle protein